MLSDFQSTTREDCKNPRKACINGEFKIPPEPKIRVVINGRTLLPRKLRTKQQTGLFDNSITLQ